MPNNRLVKKCYNMMKYFDELGNSNWCSRVKQLLQSTGFNYVWEMQDIQNESSFISAFVQRLIDQYLSYDVAVIQWLTSCHKNCMTTRYITLGYWRVTS